MSVYLNLRFLYSLRELGENDLPKEKLNARKKNCQQRQKKYLAFLFSTLILNLHQKPLKPIMSFANCKKNFFYTKYCYFKAILKVNMAVSS